MIEQRQKIGDFCTHMVDYHMPKRAMLKPDIVPTVFCFLNPAKHSMLSKARKLKALHRSIIKDLMKEPSMESQSSKEPEQATRGIGIQCG